MISQATLHREYTQRPDGTFQKIVQWNPGTGPLRTEILIRDGRGRLVRVERKRGLRA